MNFRLVIPFLMLAMFAIGNGAYAQQYETEKVEVQQAIEKAIGKFVERFVRHVPEQSYETIADCKLVSELAAMSALKYYGKNPKIDDTMMLSLSGMQRGWAALYKIKVESGVNMNVGDAVQIFSQKDMSKVLGFMKTKTPVCTKIFEAAQMQGLANVQGINND